LKEELRYRKICAYCGDNFLSYRNNAKFDTPRCRKRYFLEHQSPEDYEKKKSLMKEYYKKYHNVKVEDRVKTKRKKVGAP